MASTINVASIKARFKEFRDVDDAEIGFAIEDALRGYDPKAWAGNDGVIAMSNLVAHFLMVRIERSESGTGQVVTSERIGPIAITYAPGVTPTPADPSDFSTTPYGARYLELAGFNFSGAVLI